MSTSSEIAQLRRCFEVLEQQLNQQQQHQTTTGTSPASQHQSVTGPQRQAHVLERLLKQVTASRDELAASVAQLGARCEGLEAQLVQAKSSGEQEQQQALLQQGEKHREQQQEQGILLDNVRRRCKELEAEARDLREAAAAGLSALQGREAELEATCSRLQAELQEQQLAMQDKERALLEKDSALRDMVREVQDKERAIRGMEEAMEGSSAEHEQRLAELQQLALALQSNAEQHSGALQRRLDEVRRVPLVYVTVTWALSAFREQGWG